MIYKKIINEISEELGLPREVVDRTYKSYWKFIKHHIEGLPLKEDMPEEEFNKMRTNINIPSLGKLTCTYDRYINTKKRFKYIKKLKENNRL